MRTSMKNRRIAALIGIFVAVSTLFYFAFAGVFSQRLAPHLPDEAFNMRSMPGYELDQILNSDPSSIKSVTIYKGMRGVVADVEPLGKALIDYANTTQLVNRLQQKRVV